MDYYHLDLIDLKILEILAKDSRTTLSFLSEHTNASVPTIKSHIDKLLGLGIIDRFTFILNYELLSEQPIYFLTLKTTPAALSPLINYLLQFSFVIEIHELVAPMQILAKTLPLSMKDLNQFLSTLRQQEGFLEVNDYPLSHTYQQESAILPKQTDLTVKLRCEYCGKSIEKDYKTIDIEGVTHYLCCSSCLKLYKQQQISPTEI